MCLPAPPVVFLNSFRFRTGKLVSRCASVTEPAVPAVSFFCGARLLPRARQKLPKLQGLCSCPAVHHLVQRACSGSYSYGLLSTSPAPSSRPAPSSCTIKPRPWPRRTIKPPRPQLLVVARLALHSSFVSALTSPSIPSWPQIHGSTCYIASASALKKAINNERALCAAAPFEWPTRRSSKSRSRSFGSLLYPAAFWLLDAPV